MIDVMVKVMCNPATSPENVAFAADVIAFDARFRQWIDKGKESGKVNEATALHAYKNVDSYVEECRVAEASFRAHQDNEKLGAVLKGIIGKLGPQLTTARSLSDVMIDVLGNKMTGYDSLVLATEVIVADVEADRRALRAKDSREFNDDQWLEMLDVSHDVQVMCEDAERIFRLDRNHESLLEVLKDAKAKLDTMFVRGSRESGDVA